MKKIIILSLFLGTLYLAGFLSATQVVLSNNTSKPVEFSFKFFHDQASQKMVISGFKLEPNETTRFPQLKDLHLAQPLKLKVNWKDDYGSSISKTFDKEDMTVQDLQLIQKNGKLTFASELS